jgi:phosphate transport system substrate-binding protein
MRACRISRLNRIISRLFSFGQGSWRLAVTALLLATLFGLERVAEAGTSVIRGAGATFPMPLYLQWADAYKAATGQKVEYEGVGSGRGIARITSRTVDFGASDEPLAPELLRREKLIQFPLVMGGVVPSMNLPDIGRGNLRLTPELIADIFQGKIEKWDDRRVAAVNPGLSLPGERITVVHRADGSGTTWIFTSYLSKVSESWREKVGFGKTVGWPVGVGAKGNPGVAALIKKTPGAVGYLEFSYVVQEKLNYPRLQNASGKFVTPKEHSFRAAGENAPWDKGNGFALDLTDQAGQDTWPIVGVSYILVPQDLGDREKVRAMTAFFRWCLDNGSEAATSLNYVPIPKEIHEMILEALNEM